MDPTKYLSPDEVTQLRTVIEARAIVDKGRGRCRGPLAWMVVDLALSTGLRVSELAAIRIEDIDLSRHLIQVLRLKRKKPARESLSPGLDLLEHLRQYIGERKEGKLLIGERGPLTATGLQHIWKRAVKDARLTRLLPIRCARHTLATHLLRKTHDLKLVQRYLGHTDISSTAIYADVMPEDMRAALNQLYG